MKKSLVLFSALILLAPSLAYSNLFTFKAGLFYPLAQSDLWEIEFAQMSFQKSQFQGSVFGFSYEYFLTRQISFMIGIDGYTKTKAGVYNDPYVSDNVDGEWYAFDYGEGYPIEHTFSVAVTPLQASLKLTPFGRRGKIIPYIGGGIGIYLWSVRLIGEEFDTSNYEWFYDSDLDADVKGYPVFQVNAREDDNISFGYHALGGIMLSLAPRITLDIQFKYNNMHGTLKEYFLGFEPLDLSGYQVSLGVNYWF